MSTISRNNGVLIAQAGAGAVRCSAWENRSETGQKMGVSVTLSKFYNKQGQLASSNCYLRENELGSAIEVLKDIQQQLLAKSRDFSMRNDAEQPVVADGEVNEF